MENAIGNIIITLAALNNQYPPERALIEDDIKTILKHDIIIIDSIFISEDPFSTKPQRLCGGIN
jgi:hypothetical protein